ncbi:hypothetical protein [Streptomyces sp. NPDC004546]|uniref:DUF7134 domain-containing protein n=1 Tax=unclassified Streptomyces TaxID=2593676 RepID=UPI0033BF6198
MRVRTGSSWPPGRVDAVVTVTVVVLGVVDSWIKPSSGLLTGLPLWIIATVSGAVGGTLWWRRRHPEAVAGVVIVGHVVAFTPVALAVAMYTVGARCRRLSVLAGFGVAGFVAGVVGLRGGLPNAGVREAGYAIALILGPLAVGYAVASRSTPPSRPGPAGSC